MRKYGFGLVGCGRISRNHLESIRAISNAELVAVCDTDDAVLQKTMRRYQCQGYLKYHDMLSNPEIEIVNICTPSGLHAKIAVDALNAGKHVLVEKPMAMSLHEADSMIEAAKRQDLKLGVVHQNRFNKAVVKLRQALEMGRFGRLTHGSAVVRWNRDDNYYIQAPWRGTWAQDGGCLMNQSIHNIDLLQWMMGPVETVYAHAATNLRNIEGEDTAMALLKFRNGAFGSIEASTTIYPRNLEETLNIFGTTGTAVIGGIAVNQVEAWRFEGDNEDKVIREQSNEPPNVYGFGHGDIIADFIEAVENDREPAVSGQEGRKALEIVLAIYHSVKYHKEITLPLKESFRIGVLQDELYRPIRSIR